MSPEKTRKRLKAFFIQNKSLFNYIFNNLSKNEYKRICQQVESSPNFDEGLKKFILDHYYEIGKKTETIIDELCEKAVPKEKWFYLIRQFGIISALLIPAMVLLVRYAIRLFSECNHVELSLSIVSILLLFGILISACYAVFKDNLS